MASQAWYEANITQRFGQNGEKGIDLGTPFHTPITALYGGTVRWAGRTQWNCGSSGGEVTIVCTVPGYGVMTSYYLHLDEVFVKTGDVVAPGQQIGISGGQLSGGQWPVVNCPPTIYSDGPHTEFGFNAPWVSGPGSNVDPLFAITAARNGSLPTQPGTPPNPNPTGGNPLSFTASGQAPLQVDISAIEAGVLAYYNMTSVAHRVVTQPTGADGICEAIDYAEEYAPWNWLNPFGSVLENAGPFAIQMTAQFTAVMIVLIVLWTIIEAPVIAAIKAIAPAAISAAVPEAAPVVAAATAPAGVAR